MRAVTYSRYGGPDVLELADVAQPQPEPGQILVRVVAAGVNPLDVKLRRGDLAAHQPAQFPVVPGLDAAGSVEAVGQGTQGLEVGDSVFGVATTGSYADHAVLAVWEHKPPSVPWELAASLPTVGEAAFRALKHLGVGKGDTLLIHGATGSVGSLATQLATRQGIRVIGSVAPADLDRARALGADPVAYGDGLVDRVRALAPEGVSHALDAAGAGVLPDSIQLTGSTERVITLADPNAA